MTTHEPMNTPDPTAFPTDMEIARFAAHLLSQNKAWRKLAQMQQGELSSAWDNGYLAGASDRRAGPSNPYTLDESDLTP